MSAILKRSAAAVAALAVGMSGLLAVSAHAADPEFGNIVNKDNATINIHKLEAGSLNPAGNVANDPAAGGDGIEGVPFKLVKLKLDLTKTEDWTKLTGLEVPADACSPAGEPDVSKLTGIEAAETNINPDTVTTGRGGGATATVSTGAYLVCEQPAANPTNAAGQSVKVVKKAAPFVVTVPVKHPGEKGGWLYDVHVFPKNTVVESPTKHMEIVKDGLGTDKGVKITISGKVSNLAPDEHFKYYSIIDPMPAELTNPKDYVVTVDGVAIDASNYAVDYGAADTEKKNMVAVNFTATGLEFLKTKPNAKISLVFYATMNALPEGGSLSNNGFISTDKTTTKVTEDPGTPVNPPNKPGDDPDPKDPNNPPTKSKNTMKQSWAKVRINKFDANDNTAKLAGAEFKIYVAATQDDTCSSEEVSGDAISVNGTDIFTTGDGENGTVKGEALISGLFIASATAEAPAEPEPATTRCFVIEEVKAPAGYVLPDANADADKNNKWTVKADSTNADGVVRDVPNTQIDPSDIPALPLTGASGQLIMMVVGSALMLGSVGAFFVIRKRQAEQRA